MPINIDSLDTLWFERLPIPTVLVNRRANCLKMNRAFVRQYPLSTELSDETRLSDIFAWEDWQSVWERILRNDSSQEAILYKDHSQHWTAQVMSIAVESECLDTLFYIMMTDITEQKFEADRIRGRMDLLEWIETNSSDFIAIVDDQGLIRYASISYEKIFGRSNSEILNRSALEYVHPEDKHFMQDRLAESLSGYIYWLPIECRYLHGNGQWIYIDARATPVETRDGVRQITVFVRDISYRKQQDELIQRMAYHDVLTGLPNRHFLQERLEHILTQEKEDPHLGLLFIDLDGFKTVNDSLGHSAGDHVLQQVAERLLQSLPHSAWLARMGGDEFVILLHPLETIEYTETVAQDILHLLSAPFWVYQDQFCLTTSIGISLYPVDGTTGEELIRTADMALYSAKATGRNRYSWWRESLEASSRHLPEG